MPQPSKGPTEFFAKADVKGITECWEWHGPKTKEGYGRTSCVRIDPSGRSLFTHQIAFAFTHGELPPPGWIVHHVCGTPACVNPAHLLLMRRGEHNSLHKKGGKYVPRGPKTGEPT